MVLNSIRCLGLDQSFEFSRESARTYHYGCGTNRGDRFFLPDVKNKVLIRILFAVVALAYFLQRILPLKQSFSEPWYQVPGSYLEQIRYFLDLINRLANISFYQVKIITITRGANR